MCLRWGICGAGKVSHDFVVGVKSRPVAEHKVVAVGARSIDSAAEFAAAHGVEKYYGSYEELSKDKDVDVVYVGTIHPAHYTCVTLMLENGKPVLCEKPLTVNMQDTASLVKKSSENGLFLMEAVWTRFFPAVSELRKLVSEKHIGDIKFVQANLGMKRKSFSGTSRLENPELGGGAVLDLGIYPISFATMVFGERPESVHATGWLTSTGVDDFAAITLKYSGERTAHLSCSIGIDMRNEAVVYGTEGNLKLPDTFWCPTKLETNHGVLDYPLPSVGESLNFVNSAGFGYEAEHVRKCLQAGMKQSDVMPLEHTLIVAEIMDSVLKQLGTVYFQAK